MFCPECGKELIEASPNFCSGCGHKIKEQFSVGDTVRHLTPNTVQTCPTAATFCTFQEYRKKKNEERQKFSKGKMDLKKSVKQQVNINVGLMSIQKGGLRPQRGKNISLQTDRGNTATSLLNQAVKKMKDFNKDVKDGPFLLLYPDATEVVNIPGTQKPFTVEAYKHELGRPYQRITLYICLKEDFEGVGGLEESSDSDMEVFIKTPSESDLADTLPWEPQHESSPFSTVTETEHNPGGDIFAEEAQQVTDIVENGNNPGTSQCLAIHNSCYRNYTSLFEPILIEDDDPIVDLTQNKEDHLPEEPVDTHVQAHEIIAQLALAINHKKVSRFNICRSDVWDGAVRGFRRSTYSDNNDMFIKFTDDAGCFEEGLDTGGPRREFLTLLTNHLRTRPIFDGPQESRYVVYNAKDLRSNSHNIYVLCKTAAREDEYFLAGKIIAVSIVHGGPAPHFLSKNLVNHMIGNPSFDATIEDVKDEEIGKVLHQVLEAASDESLQNIILQNSTMFQTAGCLRVVRTCEKHAFVEEYLRWYIIDRNHSCIQRFRDGLASLDFFSALQQHSSVLAPVLSYSCKVLTALDMENMFIPDLSPPGSNRRQKEAKTLGFWADYLSDSEEKLTAVSLEELLMFATGLASLPPAGMTPTPQIQFTSESPFPAANTCANVMKLPFVDSYEKFKENMDFGIQNAPGFGCF